ncbi:hypothetical protein D7Z54_28310 [Salibacterium salarium]|uniref:Uncharacterized protein n=1 Tax=Salibacterium salarium TaxID=284579 RepID=A0A3R9R929_9BACI|nr:hypothetical protein D7Z54_28310 [Salibacterium salarium]
MVNSGTDVRERHETGEIEGNSGTHVRARRPIYLDLGSYWITGVWGGVRSHRPGWNGDRWVFIG